MEGEKGVMIMFVKRGLIIRVLNGYLEGDWGKCLIVLLGNGNFGVVFLGMKKDNGGWDDKGVW